MNPKPELALLAAEMDRNPVQINGSAAPTQSDAAAPATWQGPARACVGAAMDEDPGEEDFIIEGLLPSDAVGLVGAGGRGKSTVLLWLAVHITLGRSVLGARVLRPGGALFISAEDRRPTVLRRLRGICAALKLTEADRARVARSIYIEDVSGSDVRLVRDLQGTVVATNAAGMLAEAYAGLGLALVVVDPTSLLGAGERAGNDGMAELMRMTRHLSERLRCAVVNVHHESKAGAREGVADQFAGRGGAAFADNARAILQLVQHDALTVDYLGRKWSAPSTWAQSDVEAGDVLLLYVHKVSHARNEHRPIWLRRQGWGFEATPATPADSQEAREAEQAAARLRIQTYVQAELARKPPVRHTPRSLENATDDLKLGRNKLRALLNEMLQTGALAERPLPVQDIHGGRKMYLVCPDSAQQVLQ